MSRIKVSVDGAQAVVELKGSSAKSIEKVGSALPLTTRLVHASRSGNCAVAAADSLRDEGVGIENQVSMFYPGMVAYDPARGYLVLSYGQGQARSNTGTHWVTYLGDVVEGMDELAAKLAQTREGAGALDITFERED